jgi:Coenzyme PQQ synthesis protein D (PqqD)
VNIEQPELPHKVVVRRLVVRADGVVAERIGAELVVMNLATEQVISLNPVAATIWSHLSEGDDTDTIVAQVAARFAAPTDVIAADASVFFERLIELDLASWQ